MFKIANFVSTLKPSTSSKRTTLYYPPFGSSIPELQYAYSDGADTSKYRFGFNNQEQDAELGEYYAFEYRIHDARLGRFLSVDPLSMEYSWNSTYAFAENDVVRCIDLEGLEKVALSGSVPIELYNTPGNNHYSATNVKMFKKQGQRISKLFGFNYSQVTTAQEIIATLINETKNNGSISYIAYFGHGDASGLLMQDQKGFYTQTILLLKENLQSGLIKFTSNTTFFLNACNTANSGAYVIGNSFAKELCLETGATVIAATGTMAMIDPKNANGKFKIVGEGNFVKLTKVKVVTTVTEEIWVKNPEKSWWEIWKDDKVKKTITKEIITYEVKETIIGKEISMDDYIVK